MKKLFLEEEIPYNKLAQVGLTQSMIEDLPMRVLDDLSEGLVTPVLPLRIYDEATDRGVLARARFSLVRNEDHSVSVMYYPVLTSSPLAEYTPDQQQRLLDGKAVLVDKTLPDGTPATFYAQIDTDTKQVVTIPAPILDRNLQTIAGNMHLSSTELHILRSGDPITYTDKDDDTTTLGIDLHDTIGVRFVEGDARNWSEQTKKDWDKYTFGINGCWVMDDDGNLDYVAEDDYTEDIWNEQKRVGLYRAAGLSR